jgi:hypothetical protein
MALCMVRKCASRTRWCKRFILSPSPSSPGEYVSVLIGLLFCSMIFLFRSGTVREKLALIFRATYTHARNLARYASIYKLTMLLLKHFGPTPGHEGRYDTFFAGLLGGYLVFGRRSKRGHVSSVSKQIVIFGMYPFIPISSSLLPTIFGLGLVYELIMNFG